MASIPVYDLSEQARREPPSPIDVPTFTTVDRLPYVKLLPLG